MPIDHTIVPAQHWDVGYSPTSVHAAVQYRNQLRGYLLREGRLMRWHDPADPEKDFVGKVVAFDAEVATKEGELSVRFHLENDEGSTAEFNQEHMHELEPVFPEPGDDKEAVLFRLGFAPDLIESDESCLGFSRHSSFYGREFYFFALFDEDPEEGLSFTCYAQHEDLSEIDKTVHGPDYGPAVIEGDGHGHLSVDLSPGFSTELLFEALRGLDRAVVDFACDTGLGEAGAPKGESMRAPVQEVAA